MLLWQSTQALQYDMSVKRKYCATESMLCGRVYRIDTADLIDFVYNWLPKLWMQTRPEHELITIAVIPLSFELSITAASGLDSRVKVLVSHEVLLLSEVLPDQHTRPAWLLRQSRPADYTCKNLWSITIQANVRKEDIKSLKDNTLSKWATFQLTT